MFNSIPGGAEPGYLGFAIVDALIDLLIEKSVIAPSDATKMLASVAVRLGKERTSLGDLGSKFITNGVPR
jgi:hypothetical protein